MGQKSTNGSNIFQMGLNSFKWSQMFSKYFKLSQIVSSGLRS